MAEQTAAVTTPANLAQALQEQAVAPTTLNGWSLLQQAVNVTLPADLNKAAQTRRAALKVLNRGR